MDSNPVNKQSTDIQGVCNYKGSGCDFASQAMHTGQIIMLTKMLTAADLRFYGFDGDVPVERWHSHPSGS